MLDASGRIVSANTSAAAFWPGESLPGRALSSLFVFEIISDDPTFLDAQWEALLSSALDRWTPLAAKAPGAPSGLPVSVRLESCPLAPAAFAALVHPALPAPPSPSVPATASDPAGAFRLFAEADGAGFFDVDLKRGRAQLSPAWKRMLGYAPGGMADTPAVWRKLIHPDDSAAAPDRAGRKTPPGPRTINLEYRMRHQAGHWVWIHCSGLQLIGPDGQVERVVGLQLDISERKELEEALVASDTRLNALAATGPLAVFELDFAHGQFWFSPAWERLLGYQEGELPATAASFAAALPADEADLGAAEWLLRRAPEPGPQVETATLRTRDGRDLPVILGVTRIISRRGELLRALGFACPAPAADAGRRPPAPALADAALHAASEGILIADAQGRITFANATAARLLGIEPAAAPGRPLREVFRLVNRRSGRPADDPVDAALATDQPLPLSAADALLSAAPGAAPLPIVWTVRAIRDRDGRVLGAIVVFRNPDEMSLTPEELVKANRFEKLALAAGGIAHDFNNVLTTILGAISLAKEHHVTSSLADAEKSCLVAKGLSRQLLAFARGSNGSLTVCPPRELLDDAVKIAAADTSALVTVEVDPRTANLHVDRPQLLQVFQNLVVNALQAMPPPPHQARIQLRAANATLSDRQVPGLAAGDYVSLEVRDNGAGIKAEHLERIFDPFFTTKKHGTGLGLATVLSLVRKHGGQIALESQVGVGTLFTIYLPQAEQAPEVQARRAPSLRFGTGRVLFMDDEPGISALTATMLESLSYKYDLARNGEEAIALYRRYLNVGRPYDAVILDLTIVGGMGGEQCFEELRKLDPEVRAIVASGYDDDDLARQFIAKGFCGYLTKPYRIGDLGKTLKAVLG